MNEFLLYMMIFGDENKIICKHFELLANFLEFMRIFRRDKFYYTLPNYADYEPHSNFMLEGIKNFCPKCVLLTITDR